MGATVVIGTQRGDEGKGKVVDSLLSRRNYDIAVRFHGGPNAGHTIVHEGRTLKLHHIPSGVLHDVELVVGPGVIVNPQILLQEVRMLKEAGIDLSSRLWVDPRCHVILPYHPLIERFNEQVKSGSLDTRSTGRGIGPTYADKAAYLGIRVEDLYHGNILAEKLRINSEAKTPQMSLSVDWAQMENSIMEWAHNMRPFVKDTFNMVRGALDRGANILAEGAHGTYLDVDWGPYPYVTASSCVAGNVHGGAGIAPRDVRQVVGVAKAYMTIVGNSPFPTRIADPELQNRIASAGNEFGTTTGRPRDCGWFDAELVRFSAELNQIDYLVLTKLDVLDGLQTIPVCVGYEFNGYLVRYTDLDVGDLWNAVPRYVELPGWGSDTSKAGSWDGLPDNAKRYIGFIEEHLWIPIKTISVGPEREQTVWRG